MKPRKDKKPRSINEQRQKELAWMLYITEGYIGNMHHAKAVNCVTFTHAELRHIDRLIRNAEVNAAKLREMMQPK